MAVEELAGALMEQRVQGLKGCFGEKLQQLSLLMRGTVLTGWAPKPQYWWERLSPRGPP
jgi:hypothetical protein